MKTSAFILSVFIGFCLVLPAFSSLLPTISLKEESCSRNTCAQETSCEKEMPCGDESEEAECNVIFCNPFMACICGNPYLVEKPFQATPGYTILNNRVEPVNDNRISSRLSECWHPPELN